MESRDFIREIKAVKRFIVILLAEILCSFFEVLTLFLGYNRNHFFFHLFLFVMYLAKGEIMQLLFFSV